MNDIQKIIIIIAIIVIIWLVFGKNKCSSERLDSLKQEQEQEQEQEQKLKQLDSINEKQNKN